MTKHWTLDDVKGFDKWLRRNHHSRVQFPILENNNGNYTMNIVGSSALSPQKLVNQYDKEVVNGSRPS